MPADLENSSDEAEIWKPYPYGPSHEVSNLGRIRSMLTRCGNPRPVPKVLKGSPWRYRSVQIGLVHHRVHVMVLETFVGPRPVGFQACHNNGDSNDNRLTNLRWASVADNNADRIRHGTQTKGSRNPGAKLTEEVIPDIRAAAARGESLVEIAQRYGVVSQTIKAIVAGRSWRHVA